MNKGIDAYYDRRFEVQRDVVHSAITRKDQLAPTTDINDYNEEMKDVSLAPWIFQSLPGTKPASQWSTSEKPNTSGDFLTRATDNQTRLAERLDNFEPYQLWNEPLDLISGGPEFFKQAKDYIVQNVNNLVKSTDVSHAK